MRLPSKPRLGLAEEAVSSAVYRGPGEKPRRVEYKEVARTRKLTFRDEEVKSGIVYYYFVRAVTKAGAESAASAKVRTQPRAVEDVAAGPDAALPAVPQGRRPPLERFSGSCSGAGAG